MKGRSLSSSIRRKPSRPRPVRRAAQAGDTWTVARALAELRRHGSRYNVQGMARYGIRSADIYGVSKPQLDQIARAIGKNHELGMHLWDSGNHDARLLGMLICESSRVTARQMEEWVRVFDNWDVCDGTCCHLFARAKAAWQKALHWTRRKKEFEKRAGFALAAYLAIHDKTADDQRFEPVLAAIEREAWDDRNFVRKAVNWALRNVGKRNARLNRRAIACAERIRATGTRAGRWIAADALRELKSDAVQGRLRRKAR
jgi:3-methyladenine DNA glycosylase AlkD